MKRSLTGREAYPAGEADPPSAVGRKNPEKDGPNAARRPEDRAAPLRPQLERMKPPAFLVLLALLTLAPGAPRLQDAPGQSFVCPPCGAECHFTTYPKTGACGVCGMELVELASVPQAGVLLFPRVDLTSSTLTLGVLASSDTLRAFTVADTAEPLRAGDCLEMKPQFAFGDCPALDVLVVPDGWGAWDDPLIVEWVKGAATKARFVLAVGTGSVVLARAGFLEGERVPVSRFHAQRLAALAPALVPDPEQRWTRRDRFFLARDALGALDAALAVVQELGGEECARRTAERLGLPSTGAKKQ
jgi:putative intracellular protease/amidase